MFGAQAMWHIGSAFGAWVRRGEVPPNLVDLVQGVQASTSRSSVGLWALARQRDLTKIGVGDANKSRSLTTRESAKLFLRGGWENSFAQGLKLLA